MLPHLKVVETRSQGTTEQPSRSVNFALPYGKSCACLTELVCRIALSPDLAMVMSFRAERNLGETLDRIFFPSQSVLGRCRAREHPHRDNPVVCGALWRACLRVQPRCAKRVPRRVPPELAQTVSFAVTPRCAAAIERLACALRYLPPHPSNCTTP